MKISFFVSCVTLSKKHTKYLINMGQNISEIFKMTQNISEIFKMSQNILNIANIFQSLFINFHEN